MYSKQYLQNRRIYTLLMANMFMYMVLGVVTLVTALTVDRSIFDIYLSFDLIVISIKGFIAGGFMMFVFEQVPIRRFWRSTPTIKQRLYQRRRSKVLCDLNL